jgi:hypothetical protein
MLTSNSAASHAKPTRPCDCVNGGGIPKQYYATQADADDAAKVINDRHPDQPSQFPYRCEEGGVWHLTSKPREYVVNAPGSLHVNTRLHADDRNNRSLWASLIPPAAAQRFCKPLL